MKLWCGVFGLASQGDKCEEVNFRTQRQNSMETVVRNLCSFVFVVMHHVRISNKAMHQDIQGIPAQCNYFFSPLRAKNNCPATLCSWALMENVTLFLVSSPDGMIHIRGTGVTISVYLASLCRHRNGELEWDHLRILKWNPISHISPCCIQ